jgi:hypothetical protein
MIPLALAIAMVLPVNYCIERDLMLNNRARSRMKLVSSALSKQFLNAANHASPKVVFTGSVCIRFKHFDLIHAHRSAAGVPCVGGLGDSSSNCVKYTLDWLLGFCMSLTYIHVQVCILVLY